MNIDIYNSPSKTVNVLCYKTLNTRNYSYIEGAEYTLTTEMFDNNGEQCVLGWIPQKIKGNNGFGARFTIKGNLLNKEWLEFSDYFLCPIQRNREQQLNLIGI